MSQESVHLSVHPDDSGIEGPDSIDGHRTASADSFQFRRDADAQAGQRR